MFGIKKAKLPPRLKKIDSIAADWGSSEIWIDTETGVHYLWHETLFAGGITPLLGSDGKPVITLVVKEN